jgi:hypothetical protein
MTATAHARQPAAAFRCPVCGEDVPAGAHWWEPVAAVPGRLPAWRLRHRRRAGGWCILWAGEALEESAVAGQVA